MSLREYWTRADQQQQGDVDMGALHQMEEAEWRCETAARLMATGGKHREGIASWQKAVDILHGLRMESKVLAEEYYAKVPLMVEARVTYCKMLMARGKWAMAHEQAVRALKWLAILIRYATVSGKGYSKVVARETWNVRVEDLQYVSGEEVHSLVALLAETMTCLMQCEKDRTDKALAAKNLTMQYMCWAASYCLTDSAWIKGKMGSAGNSEFIQYWNIRQTAMVTFAKWCAMTRNFKVALEVADGVSVEHISTCQRLAWRSRADPSCIVSAEKELLKLQRSYTIRKEYPMADIANRVIAKIMARKTDFRKNELRVQGSRFEPIMNQFHNRSAKQAFVTWYEENLKKIRGLRDSLESACNSPNPSKMGILILKLRHYMFSVDIIFTDDLANMLRSLQDTLAKYETLASYVQNIQCYYALYRLRVKRDLNAAERVVTMALESCRSEGSNSYLELKVAELMVTVERGKRSYEKFLAIFRQLQEHSSQLQPLGLKDTVDRLYFQMHMRPNMNMVKENLSGAMLWKVIFRTTHNGRDQDLKLSCNQLSALLLEWLDNDKHEYSEEKFSDTIQTVIDRDDLADSSSRRKRPRQHAPQTNSKRPRIYMKHSSLS